MEEHKSELNQLKNMGRMTEQWLNRVGVFTRDDLETLGPVGAYKLLKQQGIKPTMNVLYAIEGALTDTHWLDVSAQTKAKLRAEAKTLKLERA